MHDSVLHAPDIGTHGHPLAGLLCAERLLSVVHIEVAEEVPARVDKGVQSVYFSLSRATTFGTRGFTERGELGKSLALLEILAILDVWKQHWQVVVRHRHFSTTVAVHNGDGYTPVALSADQPVSESVLDTGSTNVHRF